MSTDPTPPQSSQKMIKGREKKYIFRSIALSTLVPETSVWLYSSSGLRRDPLDTQGYGCWGGRFGLKEVDV